MAGMTFTPEFFWRDFGGPMALSNTISFYPQLLTWKAIGGPERATITVYGDEAALTSMFGMLRCPVNLYDSDNILRWWGFVKEVTVRSNTREISVSLADMANRTQLVYNQVDPGTQALGIKTYTAWYEDKLSKMTYGTKELRETLNNALPSVAESAAAALLASKRLPAQSLKSSGAQSSLSATLRLAGWYETLGWKYYANSSGLEGYTAAGGATQNLGDVAANTRIAQSVTIATGGWGAYSVKIKVRKAGSPADNLVIDLKSGTTFGSGTVLATTTLTGSLLPTSLDWVTGVLSTNPALVTATSYHIEVRRSGANDATNYYVVDVNTALGYAGGTFSLYNGSTWGARTPDADMLFQITGVQDTGTQIATAILNGSEFLTGTAISATGVTMSQYQNGDRLLLKVIENLLKAGNSANQTLLAYVSPSRLFVVEPEPSQETIDYAVDSSMGFWFKETAIPKSISMAGKWVRLRDMASLATDLASIVQVDRVFIDSYEYSPPTDSVRVTSRGVPTPWDTIRALVAG